MSVMPAQYYDGLSRRVKRHFVHALTTKLTEVWQRRWNVERFIVFQTVILQRA